VDKVLDINLAWLYRERKFSTVAAIDMEYLEGRVLVKFNG
jgi:hypothetical protein